MDAPPEPFPVLENAGPAEGPEQDSEDEQRPVEQPAKGSAELTGESRAQVVETLAALFGSSQQAAPKLDVARPLRRAAPPAQSAEAKPVEPLQPGSGYAAGSFGAARLQFIRDVRSTRGLSFAAANEAWMLSDVRTDFLSRLTEKELKRRRFM